MFSTYPYYNSDKFHFYGQETMEHMIAFRTMLDAGIVAAAGSDFGARAVLAADGDPGHGDAHRLERRNLGRQPEDHPGRGDPGQHLNGAYNSREEKDKGSITTGKLADFVVLAEDLHAVDPAKIKDVKIVRTVVGGRTVYQA